MKHKFFWILKWVSLYLQSWKEKSDLTHEAVCAQNDSCEADFASREEFEEPDAEDCEEPEEAEEAVEQKEERQLQRPPQGHGPPRRGPPQEIIELMQAQAESIDPRQGGDCFSDVDSALDFMEGV